MWEKLGYKDIDASVLSRFLSGERLLNLQQFKIFCLLLGIKETEERNLQINLNHEILNRFGQGENFDEYRHNAYIEKVRQTIQSIQITRAHDTPMLAYEWAMLLNDNLNQRIKITRNQSRRRDYFLLLGELLVQIKILLLEAFPFHLSSAELQNLVPKFTKIAKELNSTEYAAYAQALQGNIFFNNRNISKGISCDRNAIMGITNNEEKGWVLGRLGIEYALMGDRRNALRVKGRLLELVGNTQDRDDLVCINIKYASQIDCLAGNESKSRDMLNHAWKIFSNRLRTPGTYIHIRKIQLNHSELLYAEKFHHTAKREYIQNTKTLSRICGYTSYLAPENSSKPVIL